MGNLLWAACRGPGSFSLRVGAGLSGGACFQFGFARRAGQLSLGALLVIK